MKRTIPFEFFEKNQHMYFDIQRLAMLEKLTGQSVGAMQSGIGGAGAGLHFVLYACVVGLAHHNYKASLDDYAKKIDAFIDAGGMFSEIEEEVGRAIVASGIYGKKAADIILGLKPETEADGEAEDPNAKKPVE